MFNLPAWLVPQVTKKKYKNHTTTHVLETTRLNLCLCQLKRGYRERGKGGGRGDSVAGSERLQSGRHNDLHPLWKEPTTERIAELALPVKIAKLAAVWGKQEGWWTEQYLPLKKGARDQQKAKQCKCRYLASCVWEMGLPIISGEFIWTNYVYLWTDNSKVAFTSYWWGGWEGRDGWVLSKQNN